MRKYDIRAIPALMLCLLLAACAGTQQAYQEAEGLDQYAYVMTEHYSALLNEAADYVERPAADPAVVESIQEIEAVATPAFQRLNDARQAWEDVQNVETEQALNEAIGRAVALLNDLINVLREVS